MQQTAAFITLGCKINQYETEAIREEVLDLGYTEVEAGDSADVYVVNTCSVTAMAGTKSRKAILRAARKNPDARIIVVGCSSDSEKDKIRQINTFHTKQLAYLLTKLKATKEGDGRLELFPRALEPLGQLSSQGLHRSLVPRHAG